MTRERPFSIPTRGSLSRVGGDLLERCLGLRRLQRIHQGLGASVDALDYVRRALVSLDVTVDIPPSDLDRIPTNGPLVVVANHPTGLLDGLLAADVLGRTRRDVRFLANRWLERIDPIRSVVLPIELDAPSATSANASSVRAALRHLRDGGVLIVFPSGEVAHRAWRRRSITESPWQHGIGRIVRRARCPVLPLHIAATNSAWFHLAGLVHPALRTAMLPRELIHKVGATVSVRLGHPTDADRLARLDDDRGLVDYLRLRTQILGRRTARSATGMPPRPTAAIAEPLDRAALHRDVAALGEPLVRTGGLEVHLARADAIPSVLREIGRLREVTFRAVGEGSGSAIDLDRYDAWYRHLFVWDRRANAVVGAYRLGLTDEIRVTHGTDALYASSLFRLAPAFWEHVTPGIELGRAFVVGDRQRAYLPLLLLWRGIAAFVSSNPRYRRLFGLVSISRDYLGLSRRLIIEHLERNSFEPAVARWVTPRHPITERDLGRAEKAFADVRLADLVELSGVVADLENDAKGVPVLIREYLKLGGRLLGFNVDRAFGDVVDGLMLVDLDSTDRRRLERLMGRDAAAAFLDAPVH